MEADIGIQGIIRNLCPPKIFIKVHLIKSFNIINEGKIITKLIFKKA